MEDLNSIYNGLWTRSTQLFEQGIVEYDSFIDDPHDQRRGITLLARFDEEIWNNIHYFLQEGMAHEPEQYFYRKSDLHITVLTIISCSVEFNLSHINPQEYISLIKRTIKDLPPFTIQTQGITASSSCVLLQGFPRDGQLNGLRNQLRTCFEHAHLQHSIDERYTLQTAHSTVIRFRKNLKNPQKFLTYLHKYRDWFFGTLEVKKLELVFNDWYHRTEIVKPLHTFELGGEKYESG